MSSTRFGAAALALLLPTLPAAAQSGPIVSAGTIVLRDLTFENGPFSGTVGALEFTGLSHDGSDVTARAVKIEGLTIRSGIFDADLPSLVVTDFEGPASVVDAATSGQFAKLDWTSFLTRSKAVRIDAPRLVYRLHDKNGEQLVTTEGLVFENLADGKLGSITMAKQDSAVTGAEPGGSAHGTVGTTRYEAIDLAEFVRFASGGDGPAKRLVEKATSQAIAFQSGDLSVRIGSTSASGILGRAPGQALTFDDITRALAGAVDTDDGLRRKVAGFMRDLVTYFRMERSGATDLELVNADVPVTIASANFDGVGLSEFSLFELNGIGSVSPVGDFRLGRFAVEDFSWRDYLDRVLLAIDTAEIPSPTLDDLPKLGAIRLQNFESATAQGPVAFEELSLQTLADKSRPDTFGLFLKRLKLRLTEGEAADWKDRLLAFGYRQITADGQIVLRFDRAAKVLTLERSGVSIDDAGSVSATVRLDGVDLADIAATTGGGTALDLETGKIMLGEVLLEANDAGLLPRFYASIAKDAGVSADAIRAGMAAEIRSQASLLLGDALTPGSADAIAAYLRDPGKLTVHLVPRADRPPLSLAEATSDEPPLLSDRVTITIEAGK